MPSCPQCQTNFEITAEDLQHLDKISPTPNGKKYLISPPTLCPDCRRQRRLAFRNERKLYQRKCDLCQATIVSMYSPDKALTVYCPDCWWSDKWDPLKYGRNFDFTRSLFDQMGEILKEVPLLSNAVWNSVNCEYNGYCVNSKDCYMSSRVAGEKILYSYLPVQCLECADSSYLYESQYCYECIDCWNCYKTVFSQQCKNTSDSAFCYDCIGCKNCFGCIGLRNCEYYFFNEKLTKEAYAEKIKNFSLDSFKNVQEIRKKFEQELLKKPHRANIILNSENVSGDYIKDSKNIVDSFDIEKTETAKHSWGVEYGKDIVDSDFIYYGENCYENMSNSESTNIFFTTAAIGGVYDLMYCMMCVNGSHDCFGSIALKKQQYCILNKQYSKEEYYALLAKIIEHVAKTSEYGEFFPVQLSPFSYNETVAQEYFPLTKETAAAKRWPWKEEENKQYVKQNYQIPDSIKTVPESILKEILACTKCEKNYKVVPQELKFYKQEQLPIPRKCPDCRHKKRIKMRNPRKMWARACAKCAAPIQTSYAPERLEIVYCEKCYLKEVY